MQVNHTPSATRTLLAPPSPLFGVVYIVFWILLMLAEHLSIEPDCAALSLIANLVHLFTKCEVFPSMSHPTSSFIRSASGSSPTSCKTSRCQNFFKLPHPRQSSSTPAHQQWPQPLALLPTPTSAPTISDLKSAFFSNWNSARIRSCAFRGPLYGGGRRIQRSYQDH